MKINGPGHPPAPDVSDVEAGKTVSDAGATGRTGETGRAFAEKLAAPAAGGIANPAGGIAVADLAAALRAGHLTSRAAVDELVNRIVTQQLGAQAPAGVREQVRAALEDALENDPLLAAKLRQVSQG